MTTQANNDQVSDQVDDPSGVNNSKDQDSSHVNDDNAPETVSYHTHKKLLAQRKADQLRTQQLQQELEDYKKREAEAAEKSLEEQSKFKELADQRAKRIAELESKEKEREKALLDGSKLNAFRDKLPGKVKNSSYYAFVNLDAIEVDPDTGLPTDESVEREVNKFVTTHSGLYTPKDGAKLPGEAAQPAGPSNFEQELKQCKSQKEYDACLKKWGRSAF